MRTDLLQLTPRHFRVSTDACDAGRDFAVKFQTMAQVWDACERVDWLVWILNAIDAPQDEKAARLFMVWCARNTPLPDGRTTLSLLTDQRSLDALIVAVGFTNGSMTEEDRSAAESAARSAAWSAARSAAWSAARSAQAAEFKRVVENPFI